MVTSLKYYPRIKLEILLELILFEIPLARTDMTACNKTGSKKISNCNSSNARI